MFWLISVQLVFTSLSVTCECLAARFSIELLSLLVDYLGSYLGIIVMVVKGESQNIY